jgi:hypothetical protein
VIRIAWLGWLLRVLAAVVALVGLDRLLLILEDKGYIYYRRRRASPGSMASALLEVESHLRPSTRHEVHQRREVRREADESGEPPPQAGESRGDEPTLSASDRSGAD